MGMTFSVAVVKPDCREQVEADLKEGRGLLSIAEAPRCSLEKTWGALHFVLTGSAYEGEMPQAFLLHGGEFLSEPEDEIDTPPRWISTGTVQELHTALQGIDDAELARRCDVPAMVAEDVYSVSEELADDLVEEVADCFRALKELVASAAEAQAAMIVSG